MFETSLFEWAGRSFGISSSTQLNSDLTVRTVTVTNNINGYAYIDDVSLKSGGLLFASAVSTGVYIIGSVVNTAGRGTIWFSVKDTNSYNIRYISIAP